ncbi:hypothetical protein H0H93_001094 [Arthromyces matolae]|nr:hypothetical protein H0H93_001094 [Arthromyces matolae]
MSLLFSPKFTAYPTSFELGLEALHVEKAASGSSYSPPHADNSGSTSTKTNLVWSLKEGSSCFACLVSTLKQCVGVGVELSKIFGYLQPLDLLRLARSWKQMRKFLMSRHSNFQRAGKIRQIRSFSSLPEEYWELARLTGKVVHNTSFAPITSRDTCHSIMSLDILQDLSEQHAAVKFQPQKLEMWLNKTRDDHATWASIADELAAWLNDQAGKRSDELAAARQRRLEAVTRNLIAAGYGEVVEKMDLDLLRQHKLVRKPGDLTERVWANIKSSLLDFMVEVELKLREQQLLEEITRRRRLFAKYISDHCPPRHSVFMPIAELCQTAPIKSIIETSPAEEALTYGDFPPPHVFFMLSNLWQQRRRLELVQIMRKCALVPRTADVDHLNLATTFFSCDGPGHREPLGQQNVLVHPAAFSRRPDREYGSSFVARLFDDLQQEFWNYGGDRIAFHEGAYLSAQSIVAAAGYDPTSTVAATMDGLSFLFESVAHIVGEIPFFRCHLCHMFGDAALITNHIRERHVLYQTVTVMRQPHSPVRIPAA